MFTGSLPAFVRVSIFLTFGVLAFAWPARGQDAASCAVQFTRAQSAYFDGDFEQAVALFTPCIEAGAYQGANAATAYTLTARSHVVLGDNDQARELISRLLLTHPGYTPDPRLPPPFRSFINDIKAEMLADGRLAPPVAPIETPDDPTIAGADSLAVDPPEIPTRSRGGRRFLLFGGGAAVAAAGVVAAVALGGGGGEEPPPDTDFPGPPSRPTGQ
jgi:hypothetical protein